MGYSIFLNLFQTQLNHFLKVLNQFLISLT